MKFAIVQIGHVVENESLLDTNYTLTQICRKPKRPLDEQIFKTSFPFA